MQVFINGTVVHAPDGASLADLLAQQGMEPKSCATAVNGVFVARDARGATALKEDDHIMTFEPITGG